MGALIDPRGRKKGYSFVSIPVSWLDDRPFAQLSHCAFGAFLRLYLLAGRFNNAGALVDERGALESNVISFMLRCDQAELEKLMQLLETCSLIDQSSNAWRVTSFTDEQININERREKWAKTKNEQRKKTQEVEQGLKQESELDEKKEEKEEGEGEEEVEVEVEEEGEVEENTRGVFEDTLKTPAAATASSAASPLRPERLFHDVYNLAKKKGLSYRTECIQQAIIAVREFVEFHNEKTGDNWTWYNPEMALEFCEPGTREERWERELKNLKNAAL